MFRQHQALAALPDRIAGLTAEIGKLEADLADGDLFRRAPDRFRQIAARLEDAKRARGAAEDEWLEIELLAEQLRERGA